MGANNNESEKEGEKEMERNRHAPTCDRSQLYSRVGCAYAERCKTLASALRSDQGRRSHWIIGGHKRRLRVWGPQRVPGAESRWRVWGTKSPRS